MFFVIVGLNRRGRALSTVLLTTLSPAQNPVTNQALKVMTLLKKKFQEALMFERSDKATSYKLSIDFCNSKRTALKEIDEPDCPK